MKKILFLLFAVTLFAACSKDDDNNEPVGPIEDLHELYQEQLTGQWLMQDDKSPVYLYKFNNDSTYSQYKIVNKEKKTIYFLESGKFMTLEYNKLKQTYEISFDGTAYAFSMPNKDEFKLGSTYKRDNTEYTIVAED